MCSLLVILLISTIPTTFPSDKDNPSAEKSYKDHYKNQVSLKYKENVYHNFLNSIYDAKTKQELTSILQKQLSHANELNLAPESSRLVLMTKDLLDTLEVNKKTIKEVKVILRNKRKDIRTLVNQNTYMTEMKSILRAMQQDPVSSRNLINWMSNQFETSLKDTELLVKVSENKLKNKDKSSFKQTPNNTSLQDEEPSRIKIFNYISGIMGVKDPDKLFKLKYLIKSDAKRYTVLIEDQSGKEHILDIRRQEGPSQNKHLLFQGRSNTMDDSPEVAIHLNFPQNSEFLDQPEINPRAKFYIHSANNDVQERDEKKESARAILQTVAQLLFPTDLTEKNEEHLSNTESNDNLSGGLGFSVHDWKQLLLMGESDRVRISKLMAYSEFFEKFGVSDQLLDNLIQDLLLPKSEKKKLLTELKNYYPNPIETPRDSTINYYYLLSVLEDHGLEDKSINYSLIKILNQLEGHENLLIGEDHTSPRKEFEKRIRPEFDKLKAFSKNPLKGTTKTEAQNHLKILLALMKVDKKTKKKILSDLTTLPDKFLDLIKKLKEYNNKKNKISLILNDIPQTLKNKNWNLTSAEGLALLLAYSQQTNIKTTQTHNNIKDDVQIDHEITANSVGTIYGLGGEGGNSLFWSLWDQDKKKAMAFLEKLATAEKQLGFGAFALTLQTFSLLTRPNIPYFMTKTRFIAEHGAGMGVAMVVSELVHRSVQGKSFSEAVDSIMTASFLKELTYGRLKFMAAIAAFDQASKVWLRSQNRTIKPCPTAMRRIGRMSLIFMGAEGLDRTTRMPLEKLSILDELRPNINKRIQKLSHDYLYKIESMIDQLKNDSLSSRQKLNALFDENHIKEKLLCQIGNREYPITSDNLSSHSILNVCSIPFENNFNVRTSKAQPLIDGLLEEVDKLISDNDNNSNQYFELLLSNIKRRSEKISNTLKTAIDEELTPSKRSIFLELSMQEQLK